MYKKDEINYEENIIVACVGFEAVSICARRVMLSPGVRVFFNERSAVTHAVRRPSPGHDVVQGRCRGAGVVAGVVRTKLNMISYCLRLWISIQSCSSSLTANQGYRG